MNSSDHQESARSKETRGPRLFADFGKPAYDLLSYGMNQYFSISTGSDNGLTLTPYAATLDELSKAGVTEEFDVKEIRKLRKLLSGNFCIES